MTGHHSSVGPQIHKGAAQVQWTHCSMCEETVAVTKMQVNLKSVLNSIVKTVNFIKTHLMHSHRFLRSVIQSICPLDSGVKWLSRGTVLLRLSELHKKVQMFIKDSFIRIFC